MSSNPWMKQRLAQTGNSLQCPWFQFEQVLLDPAKPVQIDVASIGVSVILIL